jgi:anti-sigma factor ChrR (cupin superfamily)
MTSLDSDATPGMSYTDFSELPWEEISPGQRRKVLRLDESLYVAISEWDAGFQLPFLDEHGAEELVYVLEGTFVDQYRSSGPGTSIRGEPGSSHTPGTPDGVTFFTVRSLTPDESAQRLAARARRAEAGSAS